MKLKPHLRNRANDKDRPDNDRIPLREVSMESVAGKKCKEAGGHDHIFLPFDRYGCCR